MAVQNEEARGRWFPGHANTYSVTFRSSDSTGGSNLDYYWGVTGLTATNEDLEESWAITLDPFRPQSQATTISRVELYYTNTSHEPSNKKTELAPAGFQSVLLTSTTLNSNLNKYVRIAAEETKTLDVLGATHFTGSVTVGDKQLGFCCGRVDRIGRTGGS